ncbi:MAG: tetratricopeptide repeat protein [Lewinellaceae bacterium]|nr:tetratricopeptide repeat protein [Lewinellaceae bacterium]
MNNPEFRNQYASGLLELGKVYLQLGRLDSAKILLEDGLQVKRSLSNLQGINRGLNFMGLFYDRIGDYEKSHQYYLQALEGSQQLKDTANIATLLGNIAGNFIETQNWTKAEEYAKASYALARKKGYKVKTGEALVYMAVVARQQGREEDALQYYEEMATYFRLSNNYTQIISSLLPQAKIWSDRGNFVAAQKCLEEARQFSEKSGDQQKRIEVLMGYGNYYLRKKQAALAIPFLEDAISIADAKGFRENKASAMKLAAEAYEANGQTGKGLAMLKAYMTLNDSLGGERQQKAILEMESRYQFSEKEKQISLLNTQNELKDLRLAGSRRTQWYLLALVFALVAALAAGVALVRTKQRANKELSEKNVIISTALAEKELLLKEIHHRVKNNLQVISSLLKLQSRHLSDGVALAALQEGRNRVQSMVLIHQNLYQENNLTGIQSVDYISKLTQTLLQSYQLEPGKITLETDVDAMLLDVDTAIPLGLILNELISNALKHAFPENHSGAISVALKHQNDRLLLRVADNGVGMKGDSRPDSFGFELVTLLAEKLQAELSMTSAQGTQVELHIQNFKLV